MSRCIKLSYYSGSPMYILKCIRYRKVAEAQRVICSEFDVCVGLPY